MDFEEKLAEVTEEVENEAKAEEKTSFVDLIKNSSMGKTILGEDDKFDMKDVERLTQEAKESKLGKVILGEDGKFDKEDIKRLSGEASDAIKEVVGKAKDIFRQ